VINLPIKPYYKINRKRILNKYKDQFLLLGNNVVLVDAQFKLHNYVSNNAILHNVTMDNYSYIGMHTQIRNATIGKFCSIADNVKIGLGFHPVDRVSTHPAFYSNNKGLKFFAKELSFDEYKPTIVGNDVWIGSHTIIFGGITIGDGAVVAGGSIITKDVEPYSIVGGNPAKLIRYRFDQEVIKQLMEFKWWDKDVRWIENNYKSFNVLDDFLTLISSNDK
jgi:acetyltransferase-like isoleucine patch superfamily enzyme